MSASPRRYGFVVAVLGVFGTLAYLRLAALRRAAEALGTRIPRGAMAIRRESLVDLTVDGHPMRQTVFIAEASGETEGEILAGEIEDLTESPDRDDEALHDGQAADPSETNASGTATDVADRDAVERNYTTAELYAEAEAVLAEATRIEEDAALDHVVDDELRQEADLEASMEASDTPAEVDADDVTHVLAHDGACPSGFPIKVRFATRCYHEPSMQSYDDTVADACYASVEAAEADGFNPSPLD